MSARDEILKSVRKHLPVSTPLPEFGEGITFDDPAAQFAAVLEGVGGRCVHANDHREVQALLREWPAYREAQVRVSTVAGIGEPTLDLNAVDDPHALDAVDFALLEAEFAVAENGAVWVSGTSVKHRAIYFIPQHLAFVVPANEIASNMHEAYQRLRWDDATFGVFISGPSKTADIEQSLVIGAHGPRSSTVFLVGA